MRATDVKNSLHYDESEVYGYYGNMSYHGNVY